MKSDDLIVTLSPKKQVYSFFATQPLLRLKGNASATPPTSVFSTLNIPSLASFCLWPGSLLEPSLYLMTERETEAKTGSEVQVPTPPPPYCLLFPHRSFPFPSSRGPVPGGQTPPWSPGAQDRHSHSFSLPWPLGGRGRGREPARSLPSRRSSRRGCSAAPVAKATRSAARCGRRAARRRRCGPAARARRGGGAAGEQGRAAVATQTRPHRRRLVGQAGGWGAGDPREGGWGQTFIPRRRAGAAPPPAL